MKLPIPTSVPLDVLGATIEEYLDSSMRILRIFENANITMMWHFFLYSESEITALKGQSGPAIRGLRIALEEQRLRFGELRTHDSFVRDGTTPPGKDLMREIAMSFREQYGIRREMRIDELFVYVPAERPPLTDEQVAFLRSGLYERVIDSFGSAQALAEETGCATMFDAALMLTNLKDEQRPDNGARELKGFIEVMLGRTLPLQLTVDEIRRCKGI